jgi:hypothetical protein
MIRKLVNTKPLRRELYYFFFIGLLTTSIDFFVYSIGHHFIPVSIAKTFSFITGSCFSYLLHKHFTFQQRDHKIKNMFRFAAVYILSMLVNVLVNSASISLLTQLPHIPWLTPSAILLSAFVAATAISTAINFCGQKFWVFKNSARIESMGLG